MFAVVQIGSSERRSPCITARMVRARDGCACVLRGSAESAVVTIVPCTKRRRVVRMKSPPSCLGDLLTEARKETSPAHTTIRPSGNSACGQIVRRALVNGYLRASSGEGPSVAIEDFRRDRCVGGVEMIGGFHADIALGRKVDANRAEDFGAERLG